MARLVGDCTGHKWPA